MTENISFKTLCVRLPCGYGRAAPIVRNREIVEYADKIIAFWDGKSRGTRFVIEYANKIGKPCEVVMIK